MQRRRRLGGGCRAAPRLGCGRTSEIRVARARHPRAATGTPTSFTCTSASPRDRVGDAGALTAPRASRPKLPAARCACRASASAALAATLRIQTNAAAGQHSPRPRASGRLGRRERRRTDTLQLLSHRPQLQRVMTHLASAPTAPATGRGPRRVSARGTARVPRLRWAQQVEMQLFAALHGAATPHARSSGARMAVMSNSCATKYRTFG